ncbi:MAG: SH3 domain-containing protein [Thermoanaerobaculia bacterium]
MRAASRPLAVLLAALLLLAGRPAAAEHITLSPGARLHLEPDVKSHSLALLDAEALVEVLERKDGWILVRYDAFRGWVREGAPRSLVEERGDPDVPSVVAPGVAHEALLARGRALLRGGGRELPMDGRTLLTDVSDEALLKWLVATPEAARFHFELLWGRARSPAPGSVVFLFESAEAEKEFSSVACGATEPLGERIASLALSGKGRARDRERLLHQVGHLYVRDLLGDGVPPWIEEGLSDEFARAGIPVEIVEGWRAVHYPKRSLPSPPVATVPEILAAGAEIFGREPAAEARRLEALLFFRYLAGDHKTFLPFRDFVTSGGKLDPPALEEALRRKIGAIEQGYLSARPGIR